MGLKDVLENAIGELPLIGPDAGREVELLLAGVKPIGLFTNYLPDPEVNFVDTDGSTAEICRSIEILDSAVDEGKLLKNSVTTRDEIRSPGFTLVNNFYCQPPQYDQMILLSSSKERGDDLDWGSYFGYKKVDKLLWQWGGYKALPIGIRHFFEATHDFRKECRIKAKLRPSPSEIQKLEYDR